MSRLRVGSVIVPWTVGDVGYLSYLYLTGDPARSLGLP